MPYIPRMKYVYLTFATAIRPSIGIDTSATDTSIAALTLPTLKGNIVGIQTDLIIGNMEDSSASDNYLNGTQQLELDVDAGGYDSVINLAGTFYVFASTQVTAPQPRGDFILNSALTKPIVWGSTLTYRWGAAKAAGDDLELYDLQCIANILVRF